MHYPYPYYLDKASKEALKSYDMIVMNSTATKGEKEMLLNEWAKMQGDDILVAFLEYFKYISEYNQNIGSAQKNCSHLNDSVT